MSAAEWSFADSSVEQRSRALPAVSSASPLTSALTQSVIDAIIRIQRQSYLRQGGYVFVVVCLSVCLSVTQNLPNGFAWNFQGRLAMGQ